MVVESPVLSDVVPDSRQQDQIVKPLSLLPLHVGGKETSCLVHGTSRPALGVGQVEHLGEGEGKGGEWGEGEGEGGVRDGG